MTSNSCGQVRRVSTVDWETQCWFEHERIPVPLVADRETVYLETVRGLGEGRYVIVRKVRFNLILI